MTSIRSITISLLVAFSLSGCLFSAIYDDRYGAVDDFKVLITADSNYFYLATYTFNTLTDSPSDTVNHTRTRIERISLADGSGFGTIYAGATNSASTDGILTAARFKNIKSMIYAADKNALYILDDIKLRKLDLGTGSVTSLITSGLGNSAGLAYSSKDNALYMSIDNRIRKVNLADNSVADFVGDATSGDTDDVGLSARLSSPGALLLLNDLLYVLDTENNKIKQVDLATGAVTTLADSLKLTSESQMTHDSKQMIFFSEFNGIKTLHLETKQVNTVLPFARSLFDGLGTIDSDGGIYRPTGLYYLNKVLYAVNPYGIKSIQ